MNAMQKDSSPKRLTAQQHSVMFKKSTEAPFSSELLHNNKAGVYACAYCGHILFDSSSKFDSGTGWPSFDRPISDDAIKTDMDFSHLMTRTEIICPKCGAHLGHLFEDGPTDTRKRYCINGCALDFKEKGSARKKNTKGK